MTSNRELFDVITITALKGCDCDVATHKKPLWDAAVCIMADVLRNMDELSRDASCAAWRPSCGSRLRSLTSCCGRRRL